MNKRKDYHREEANQHTKDWRYYEKLGDRHAAKANYWAGSDVGEYSKGQHHDALKILARNASNMHGLARDAHRQVNLYIKNASHSKIGNERIKSISLHAKKMSRMALHAERLYHNHATNPEAKNFGRY